MIAVNENAITVPQGDFIESRRNPDNPLIHILLSVFILNATIHCFHLDEGISNSTTNPSRVTLSELEQEAFDEDVS